jgi:hypothetical protein
MSLSDLLSVQTTEEAEASLLATLDAVGCQTTSWKSGGALRTLVWAVADALSKTQRMIYLVTSGGYRTLATGDWLTLLAQDRYNVTRTAATRAAGTVTLTNAGAGVYSGSAGDLVFRSSTSKKEYRSTTSYSIAAYGTDYVDVVADEYGSESTAAAGEIDELATELPGVTCSNANPIVGIDEMSDPELRSLCDAKVDSMSRHGPRGAFAYYAVRGADDEVSLRSGGDPVDINRVRTNVNSSTGEIFVWLASSSGAPIAEDVTVAEESIALNATPLGPTAFVAGASEMPVDVSYSLTVYDDVNLSEAELVAAIEAALIAWAATVPIAGYVTPPSTSGVISRSEIIATIDGAAAARFNAHLVRLLADFRRVML